jgi:SAM-dependent methyltransferase
LFVKIRTPEVILSQFLFYRDGKLYDVVNDSLVEDREFFVQRAAASSVSVIEAACGTGRISIPIAQRGIDVVGLDESKPMLNEARSKALNLGVSVEWVEADCRDCSLSKQFSLIFIAFNSMLHLHDRTSFERFLSCVRAHRDFIATCANRFVDCPPYSRPVKRLSSHQGVMPFRSERLNIPAECRV